MRVLTSLLAATAVAVATLTPGAPAGAAGPAAERGAAVTIKGLPGTAEAGERVRIHGTAPAGADVVVQRAYQGSRWQRVAQAEASRSGAWSTKVRLTQGGTTSFRAVVGRSASKADRLKVYQWLRVADQPRATVAMVPTDPRTVRLTNGRKYAGSYVLGAEEQLTILMNTAGLCTRAQSTLGFAAGDQPAEDAGVAMMAGDIDKPEPSVNVRVAADQVRSIRFSLTGTRTAAFLAGHDPGSSPVLTAKAALASAQVYCNAVELPKIDTSVLARPGSLTRGW